MIETLRWQRHSNELDVQVGNALDATVDLTPVTEIPAEIVRTNWSALLPGQAIPLIGELRHGREEDQFRD